MIRCEICGQTFKTEQGKQGHMRFKHGQEPKRLMATAPEREYDEVLPSDRFYPDPHQRQISQQKRQKTQAEALREQNDRWEEELRKRKIECEFEQLERDNHEKFMMSIKPKQEQQNIGDQTLRAENERLKRELEQQNTAAPPKEEILDIGTGTKPMAWMRQNAADQYNQDQIDRAMHEKNQTINTIYAEKLDGDREIQSMKKKYEQDKIKKLEEQIKEKDREYKKLEREAIDMSAELYDIDQNEDEDDDGDTND